MTLLILKGFFVFLMVFCLCYGLIFWLWNKGIVDIPNPRSNHSHPTPRGGGLAILVAIGLADMVFSVHALESMVPEILSPWRGLSLPFFLEDRSLSQMVFWASAGILAGISFLDDLRGGLSPLIRFVIQWIAISACVVFCCPDFSFTHGLFSPFWDKVCVAIAWVYFTNAFNFMDGLNGLSVLQLITITLGVLGLGILYPLPFGLLHDSVILFAAALGFGLWNMRGCLFLGDVGSIPLGFFLSFLLLKLYAAGYPFAALTLPLYSVVDSSFAIFRRLKKREKIWEPHTTHYFQLAYRGCRSVVQTLTPIGLGNLSLMICTWIRPSYSLFLPPLIVTLQVRALKKLGMGNRFSSKGAGATQE